jgi:hypothetical protein
MNATSMNINPANAVQAQPAAGKQQDSAAQDVPFSQVCRARWHRAGATAARNKAPTPMPIRQGVAGWLLDGIRRKHHGQGQRKPRKPLAIRLPALAEDATIIPVTFSRWRSTRSVEAAGTPKPVPDQLKWRRPG